MTINIASLKEFGPYVQTSNRLNEAFRMENFTGSWTLPQLQKMETEFNALPPSEEEQRELLLYRFFHANLIHHIIIEDLISVSEYSHRNDLRRMQFSRLNRSQQISDRLMQFSNLRFGPPDKEKDEPKHDAHVRILELSKIPAPYQRRYPDEPKLLASIECRTESENGYSVVIKHLVKTSGFCHCVKLMHRETLRAIPLIQISGISMHRSSSGSFNLHIETAKQ